MFKDGVGAAVCMAFVLCHHLTPELCVYIHSFVVASEIIDWMILSCRNAIADNLFALLRYTDYSLVSLIDIRDALYRAGRERIVTRRHVTMIERYREEEEMYNEFDDGPHCRLRERLRDQIDALCLMIL